MESLNNNQPVNHPADHPVGTCPTNNTPAPVKLVPYYRVSTDKQGRSGLGLEAQRLAVEAYARATGAVILPNADYVEIESGKRHENRPKLLAAIGHAKAAKATLVVAKLDRLSRDVEFLAKMLKSDVDFLACDNPHANRLTLHILAAVAQDERERIGERTRAAMAVFKARGGKCGSPGNLTPEGRAKGVKACAERHRRAADEAYTHLRPIMIELRHQGKTLDQIAERLNSDGYTTRRGKPWNHVQVMRVLGRGNDLAG